MADRARFVLDTSAILTLRGNEPGADRVESLLRSARLRRAEVMLSFITRMELLYLVGRDDGPDEATAVIRLLDSIDVEWVSCEDAILAEAARIKSGSGISVADAWIAATAADRGAILVHKDPEFARLDHVRQERLPR